jgi:hypothetical protein
MLLGGVFELESESDKSESGGVNVTLLEEGFGIEL